MINTAAPSAATMPVSSLEARTNLIAGLRERGIDAVFHYVPLHGAPGGQRYGRACGDMTVTETTAERLVRLPLWHGIGPRLPQVIDAIKELLARAPMTHARTRG